MSHPHDLPRESVPAEDERLFEMLDRYVELLHSGDVKSRSQLIQRQPELAELLDCLDTLESLAPPGSVNVAHSNDVAETATLLVGSEIDQSKPGRVPATSQVFGKYELLDELGRGGMGVVFKARQTDLDRTVALKMILSSQLASYDEVRRFYAEAKAAGKLRHPNIVGIHEVGQIHGQHYFAMDYVDGQSLAALLRSCPMDAETAATCLTAVARAVDYLHAAGIVHRDLKPGNILIDKQGNPYVTDFGLVKVFESDSRQTQTGTIIGTPSYMSPEQAAGRHADISGRSDVYSLGAILYEMLCGRPPFQENNPLDTLVQVLEGEPTLPGKLQPHIPRELELICMRCLEKDPQNRYASAAALADDLDCFLKGEPIEARPSGIGQRLRRWARREPALVSRLVGLLVAASIVQGAHIIEGGDFAYHVKIMSVLGVWAVVSFLFQRMLHGEAIADWTRFAWAAADATLMTTVLCLAHGPLGPLLIGYPLLVAASGLFFRVRLVWFMTLASLVSFAALMMLRPEEADPPHYPVIFAAVLSVLGFVVAYQVYRVRVLSRYYQHRRLP